MSILIYESYARLSPTFYLLVGIQVREVAPEWPIKLKWGTCMCPQVPWNEDDEVKTEGCRCINHELGRFEENFPKASINSY